MTKHLKEALMLALCVGVASFAVPQGIFEGVRIDPSADGKDVSGFHTKWDSAQDRFVIFRDARNSSLPAARVFSKDAGQSIGLYPLRDFPGTQFLDVWDAAVTPGGGAVIAGILGYGVPGVKGIPLKSMLLTYDNAGALKKVWNVEPYHDHLIAVDRDGNIFALGDANEPEPYPMLVKYSPDGKVLAQFLSTSLFTKGAEEIQSGSRNGESEMFIVGDKLFLWLAPTEEVLQYSLDGKLESRIRLNPTLKRLADQTISSRISVRHLTVLENKDFLLDVNFWPLKSAPPIPVSPGLVRISADGDAATILPEPASAARRLLGTESGHRIVFLEMEPGGKSGILKSYDRLKQ